MTRAALLLALAAALFFVFERSLRSRETPQPTLVERLLPEERAKELVVAALSIEQPGASARRIVARKAGLWRALDATNAVCDSRVIEPLVQSILEARVLTRASDEADIAAFGLARTPLWRIELCGAKVLADPGRDVLLALDVGRSLPPHATLVRRSGETKVLELDFDLARLLDETFARGPVPFEDARLVAGPFPGPGRTIDRVFVDRDDGTGLELVRQLATDASSASEAAWTWQLSVDGFAKPCPAPRAEAFLAFLTSVPTAGALARRSANELGFEKPTVRLTILGSGGDAMVLELVLRRDENEAYGFNRTLDTLARMDPVLAELLAPSAASFLELDRPNLWDSWLREHLRVEPGR
ncbi:MAG: hypothetical protein K8S98_04840 [Planctomycetes bacterium]|nr:hypothetical protein [Planctomycetota bacterium]